MESQDINNFVQSASEDQPKALGFLGQWMAENVTKYYNCTSNCSQSCELAKAFGRALQGCRTETS